MMSGSTLPPSPEELDARRWATICHLSALTGLLGNGVGFVLAPLVVWLIKRNDHPWIDEQGKEAVNFQITMFLGLLVCLPLCLIVIGFIGLLAILVLQVVFAVIAGVRSSEGEHYRYPFAIRFVG